MSKGQKSFFKYVGIIPLAIMLCIVFSLQMQCENGNLERPEIKPLTPEETIRLETKFDDHLQDVIFTGLKTHFEAGNTAAMAKLLGDKITLYDPRGKKMIGRETGAFWQEQKKLGVTDLEFTVVYLRVFPIEDPDEDPDDIDNTIIATGHAVFVYRLIKESGGEVTNDSGSGVYDAPHPYRCEW